MNFRVKIFDKDRPWMKWFDTKSELTKLQLQRLDQLMRFYYIQLIFTFFSIILFSLLCVLLIVYSMIFSIQSFSFSFPLFISGFSAEKKRFSAHHFSFYHFSSRTKFFFFLIILRYFSSVLFSVTKKKNVKWKMQLNYRAFLLFELLD